MGLDVYDVCPQPRAGGLSLGGSLSLPREQVREDALQFFLHVPRTGGRTFLRCFLTPSTPRHRRCRPSYDTLRLNLTDAACGLLSSHDDYSLVHSVPFKVRLTAVARLSKEGSGFGCRR